MGIILALISAILYAGSIIVGKVSVDRNKSPETVGTVFQLFTGVVAIGFFIFDAPRVINSNFNSWFLLFLSCLSWALFTIWGFKANKLLDISVANLISQLSLVLTFFASAILFREAVTVYKILGIVLLIVGNVIVIKGPGKKGIINKEGLKYRILATLAMSVALLIDAANSPNFSVSFYNCGAFFLSGLIMLPLAHIKWQDVKAELKINWKGQLLMAIFSSVAYYLLIKSMSLAPKTIVVPVNNLSTVFVVLLGVMLLKEANNTKRKLIAAALAFGGAVLLSI